MNPYLELTLLVLGTIALFILIILFVVWVLLPGLAKLVKFVLGE